MKKLFLTSSFLLFSAAVFSQTASVKEGKAVETIPQKEIRLTKEQTLMKKREAADQVAAIQMQIAILQKELTQAQTRLANYQDVCTQLGYNE